MAFFQWLSRCAPGLSLIILIVFIECTLGLVESTWISLFYSRLSLSHVGGYLMRAGFILYSFILHFVTLVFPVRLCWATWEAGSRIREQHREEVDDDAKSISEKSDEGYKSDEMIYVEEIGAEQVQVIMAIIVPCYKEDISILEDTLGVLGSHILAKDSYDVRYHPNCCKVLY